MNECDFNTGHLRIDQFKASKVFDAGEMTNNVKECLPDWEHLIFLEIVKETPTISCPAAVLGVVTALVLAEVSLLPLTGPARKVVSKRAVKAAEEIAKTVSFCLKQEIESRSVKP